MGRVGLGGHAIFGQKLLNTQPGMGRCTCESPMKQANPLKKSSKKNSLKLHSIFPNNAGWYTETDGFLEHFPSWGNLYYKWPALQEIVLGGF